MAQVRQRSFAVSSELRHHLDLVLQSALRITGDMGNLQVFNHADSSLRIASHCGFDRAFLSFFNATHEGQAACGTALERRERVVVEDVAESVLFLDTESQEVMLKAKARAVQSTPLLSELNEPLGVLSTHYRKPTRPSARELYALDSLARYAAQLIKTALRSTPRGKNERNRTAGLRKELLLSVPSNGGLGEFRGNRLWLGARHPNAPELFSKQTRQICDLRPSQCGCGWPGRSH
jgi:hypothetical protein